MYDFYEIQNSINKIFSKDIFFLVGYPKSGTTWVQKILDAHDDICCKGESQLATSFSVKLFKAIDAYNTENEEHNKKLYGDPAKYPIFTLNHALYLFSCAAAMLLDAQQGDKEYKCIGEKTPTHIYYLDLLADIFPCSKFIHVVRDGRDCIISGWYQVHRVNPNYEKDLNMNFHKYVEICSKEWVRNVSLGQSFQAKRPERCFTIRYEDLCQDINANIRKLLDFLNVRATSDDVHKCRISSSFELLSGGRKPGDEDQSSFMRKGIIGDWKNHFDDVATNIFANNAGKVLEKFGY
jgi:hypothetical protein